MKTLEVVNPYDRAPIGTVRLRDWAEIDADLARAHQLSRQRDAWLPTHKRIEILKNLARLMMGKSAELAHMIANEGGKPGLFLVELAGAGVTRETLKTLDPTRSVAKISFSGAAAERLGDAGEGFALTEAVFDRAAVLLAFEQLGGSDRCLEMAKDYAMDRYAFGRTIAGYQAIKHKLADMYVKNELARSNAYFGAWALNVGAAELPIAAAAARVASSEAFWFASKENVQTHGGMGFTWAVDCHLYYRRSRQLALVAGAPKVWKERLVQQLERRNAA